MVCGPWHNEHSWSSGPENACPFPCIYCMLVCGFGLAGPNVLASSLGNTIPFMDVGAVFVAVIAQLAVVTVLAKVRVNDGPIGHFLRWSSVRLKGQ